MNQISIRLSAHERSCLVEAADLQAWGRGVLDHLLFEASKQLSATGAAAPASITLTFEVGIANEADALVVELASDSR